jgi:two-component sensor histidine kinase
LKIKILFLLFFSLKFIVFAQTKENELKFKNHIARANELNRINLFSESIKELNLAINLAEKTNNESELIEAKITLAELMRRTQNYEKGLEILYTLQNSLNYPKLHVRKLGRMAAIYSEGSRIFTAKFGDKIKVKYTIEIFLDQSLKLAVKKKYKIEEAQLRNELGLFLMRQNKRVLAMHHLSISSDIFWEAKDTLNYISTNSNVLENYLSAGNDDEFNKLSNQLVSISHNKKWYTAKARVFKMIGMKYLRDTDSLNFYKWMNQADKNYIDYYKAISSDQMKLFEVMYETEKFQNEFSISEFKVQKQSQIIKKEAYRSKYLSAVLLFVFFIFFITGLILIREKKIKSKVSRINSELNDSNEKYHLLMIESNHRIKNNLQMVISMLEYAGEDITESGPNALKRISNKIYTISSLHKHLYSDVHNPLVDIQLYFEEIFKLYSDISILPFEINKEIDSVVIKSERLVYFGLILNELLSNSMQHNDLNFLKVNIEVRKIDKKYIFIYCDNSMHEISSMQGVGSTLISQLIKRVGGSTFDLDKSTGKYQFLFNA